MPVKNNSIYLEDIKNRINHIEKLILKKIFEDIKKKEKRIPSNEEVIKIYKKRRAEYEKYTSKLAKKQNDIIANSSKKR